MKNKIIRLPLFLKPEYETKLIRIGKKNDGGYCIGENAIENTKILLSFGLNDDWSFDEEFFKKSNSKVIVFDPNVNFKFWLKKLIRNLKEILFFERRKFEEITEIFSYYKYKRFFDNIKKVHEQKLIAPKNTIISGFKNEQIIDLDALMKNINEKSVFLKIDIEGSEYRILDQIINYQQFITGLVIEFHNCDLHEKLIKNFINKFELQLVHVHVNNWGLINKDGFAASLEVSFSPKEYNTIVKNKSKSYPLTIDQPCDPRFQDNSIQFF
jgi:hypothetical protein